jgi:putative ABC transport system ATP-binding protein
MMDEGKIIFHADREEKKKLTVADLLEAFQKARGKSLADDKTLLQK